MSFNVLEITINLFFSMTTNIRHYVFIETNVFLTILQLSAGTHFAAPEAKSSNSQTTNLLECFGPDIAFTKTEHHH